MSKKICLDAGHYGKYNRSPAVKEYYESDMNWKLHLLLKKHLEGYGFEVITTRPNQETDKTLYNRGAASKGCDLFMSIHSNAVGSYVKETVDAPAVYVQLTGKGDEIGRKLAACIASVMGTKQAGRIATRKGKSGGEYYGVLRGARAVGTVGLLVEHSYHTNTRSTLWLMEEENLDELARAEAKVIAEHFGMAAEQKPAEAEKPKDEEETEAFKPYLAKVTASVLNVRKGPGTKYPIHTTVKRGGVYTIVGEERNGSTVWGKLKSGAGWVCLKYTKKV